jgi:eukaryotic-like serine/threonine-protein kinase
MLYSPSVALGRDTRLLREIMQKTVQRLDDLTNQPAVEAHLRTILGSVYRELGEHTNAAAMHQRALELRKHLHGDVHPDVAISLYCLAGVLSNQGKDAEAETMYRDELAMNRKLLGNSHPSVATSLNNLGLVLQKQGKLLDAEQRFREALEIRQLPMTLNSLALLLQQQGKLKGGRASAPRGG